MKTRKYKTNINCGSCVAKVTPSINQVQGVSSWEVDTNNKEKILTVSGDFKDEEVEQAITDAGFVIKS